MSTVIRDFIAGQRSALAQLEAFAGTPAYARLLKILRPLTDGDPEAGLAAWLVEHDESLGARPVEIAGRPGGLELVAMRLERMAGHVCA
ncbi:hypothetical protein [Pelomonas sp. Root1444]|uniref:hypothetical protein n=1 Tax=Pelomonas sp. Root1444 TaxID=1736464 RepID=UPI00138F1073|nr:hypothetical protein [Pelomonas sp. Root1444]